MPDTLTTEADLSRLPTGEDLGRLQFTTLLYYLHETNPDNGLVRDKTEPTTPVSIAAVGMALATIPVVVERGVIIREFAAKITRKRLRFLYDCSQGHSRSPPTSTATPPMKRRFVGWPTVFIAGSTGTGPAPADQR